MEIKRHPKLAEDIRNAAMHYSEIFDRVLAAFWKEIDCALLSIAKNPRMHHFTRVDFAEFTRIIPVVETLAGRKVECLESRIVQEWLMDRRVGSDR
jgi:hypothetical protein